MPVHDIDTRTESVDDAVERISKTERVVFVAHLRPDAVRIHTEVDAHRAQPGETETRS